MKTQLTPQQVHDIAEHLDCGFRCFWSKTDGELLFVPDPYRLVDIDMDAWSDDMGKIDGNISDYCEIYPMESHDSYAIMADFVETLPDSEEIKGRLIVALHKRKPFREFKFVIDHSGPTRQRWFNFKQERMEQWVIDQLDDWVGAGQ